MALRPYNSTEGTRQRSVRRRGTVGMALVTSAIITAAAAGCGSGGTTDQVNADTKQTITISLQGLGAETTETQAQMAEFHRANPNITVKPLILSSSADTASQQLTQRFVAGSQTPDVIISDVIWPATFAKAGWIAPLDKFNPDLTKFFPAQAKTVQYNGHTYGVPWFINAEGLYYRTDLVPTPPRTPQELVAAAQAAMKKDSSLKEGLVFPAFKYEGVVTSFQNFLGGFGGKLDISNMKTAGNQKALQFMYDTIYKYKITPTAVTGWKEQEVQDAWTSGQTAFAVNWPYLLQVSATAPAVKGKVGFVAFPSATGTPAAALGGHDLVVNAKSTHQAAAWKFIQFMSSPEQQIARAVKTGDAPAVQAAYTDDLYSQAPYFKQTLPLLKVTASRPITPDWLKSSAKLQTMLSSVLSNQTSPSSALANVS